MAGRFAPFAGSESCAHRRLQIPKESEILGFRGSGPTGWFATHAGSNHRIDELIIKPIITLENCVDHGGVIWHGHDLGPGWFQEPVNLDLPGRP